ncbi:MAG: 16S rRNA (guanine(527)-N(7))-methyltransferase RsmG [Clostridiales bacterium]|nr:16S rRNA (guanine(527)-N(7))-methyltransferase RsmG [Clostridiales bacterium]
MDQLFVDHMVSEGTELGITFTDSQMEQFYQYYQLLIEWNQVMNLTTITEMKDVITRHFIDSLSVIKAVHFKPDDSVSVIDVGSGAGFPGIPIKIAFPFLKLTLLDSLNKRVRFLNTVIQELDLKNISAIHGRSEDLGHEALYREAFDYCVSRAVANLSTLSEYCLPFVKPGGYFISYKSGNMDEELQHSKRAIHVLSGEVDQVFRFSLSDLEMSRSLILIKKVRNTEKKYPRKAGVPSKSPL